jgi:hypothetical protein
MHVHRPGLDRCAVDYAQGYVIGHPAPIGAVGVTPAIADLTPGDPGPDQNDDASL